MHSRIGSIGLAFCALLAATPALAQPGPSARQVRENKPPEVVRRGWKFIVVTDSETTAGSDRRPSQERTGRKRQSRPRFVYFTLEWFEGNRFCLRRHSTTNEAKAKASVAGGDLAAFAQRADGIVEIDCPARPRPVADPVLATDDLVRSFLETVTLPSPTIEIVPGYAITGKRVYLQIGGPRTATFTVPNPLGPAVGIDVTSDYLVDWGDGTTIITSSQGGPWPGGDVTHTYERTSPRTTIAVVQRWTAHWVAGDDQGPISGLRTEARRDLRVTEVQAVRNR